MALDTLKTVDKVIGVKQVTKAINKNMTERVFLAADADARVLAPLKALCAEKNIAVMEGFSMSELGDACGIEVRAAAAAVLK